MKRNRYMVGLVFLTFFVMSLLTNILGPIVPDIISSFRSVWQPLLFCPSPSLLPTASCRFPPDSWWNGSEKSR